MIWEEDKSRPQQSHRSFETFDLAVRDGCFICNAVLENHLAQSNTEADIALERDFEEIRFSLDFLPRIQFKGSMVCLLKFTLVLQLNEIKVSSSFLLEVNKGR